jgi:hypothetical protein
MKINKKKFKNNTQNKLKMRILNKIITKIMYKINHNLNKIRKIKTNYLNKIVLGNKIVAKENKVNLLL